MELLNDIKTLRANIQRLQEADKAYEESEPLMSDIEYDELKITTTTLLEGIDRKGLTDEECSYLVECALYLGAIRNPLINKNLDYDQVKEHYWEVKGLHTVYTVPDFLAFIHNEKKDNADALDYFFLEPKYDGINVSLNYSDNELKYALTRGNGFQGEDITKMLQGIDSIPSKVTWDGDVQICGELVISLENFEKINANSKKQYKTPRSALVAFINSNDRFRIRTYAEFIPFFKRTPKRAEKKIHDLAINKFNPQIISTWGREIIKYKIANLEHHLKPLQEIACCTGYPVDGLVITCSKTLRSVAIKPKRVTSTTTTVQGVVWNIAGKTKKLTCTLIVDPVIVENKTYTKLPVRDLSLLTTGELQLHQDIVVCVENEVLKYSQKAIQKKDAEICRIDRPSLCPRCDEPLTNKGYDYYCDSPRCSSGLIDSLLRLNKLLKISLGRNTVETMIIDGADNIYKYLKEVIETVPLAKKAFIEASLTDILRVFDLSGYKVEDYTILGEILTHIDERTNISSIKNKVHKASLKDTRYRGFKRKMHYYYVYCATNILWIDEFFGLLKKYKGW